MVLLFGLFPNLLINQFQYTLEFVINHIEGEYLRPLPRAIQIYLEANADQLKAGSEIALFMPFLLRLRQPSKNTGLNLWLFVQKNKISLYLLFIICLLFQTYFLNIGHTMDNSNPEDERLRSLVTKARYEYTLENLQIERFLNGIRDNNITSPEEQAEILRLEQLLQKNHISTEIVARDLNEITARLNNLATSFREQERVLDVNNIEPISFREKIRGYESIILFVGLTVFGYILIRHSHDILSLVFDLGSRIDFDESVNNLGRFIYNTDPRLRDAARQMIFDYYIEKEE